MGLPASSPMPIARKRTPRSFTSTAASSTKLSWSSPSVIMMIIFEASSRSPNASTAFRSGSSRRVPPRPTELAETSSRTSRKKLRSGVSGQMIDARPANAISPTWSPSRSGRSCSISSFARSRRLGTTSSASIERDTSRQKKISAPAFGVLTKVRPS